eukprot:TRINITY_DN11213_c0_g1_i2.p1 TRINITY_DN11213_c0_g1~~TRINITY_DN11213_c0_g1_i2.p1  ORF type:complete len:195 (-),score=28.79 TRINITY_DN11213_c0_g1_i2:766-1350(-)
MAEKLILNTETEDSDIDSSSSDDETKASRTMSISNALDEKVHIEIKPANLSRQTELREHHVAVGAGVMEPHIDIGFTRGGARLENYRSEVQRQAVWPHNTWRIKPPAKSVKKGESGLAESSMQIVVSTGSLELGHCLLAPGEGLVIADVNGEKAIEQIKKKKLFKSRDVWMNNQGVTRHGAPKFPQLLLLFLPE